MIRISEAASGEVEQAMAIRLSRQFETIHCIVVTISIQRDHGFGLLILTEQIVLVDTAGRTLL
jgi:hypothetical protein